MVFDSLDPLRANWLERAFDEDDIFQVVSRMVKDKAQDMDGFSMPFFKVCWENVKEDVMRVFQEFFSIKKLEKFRNATFIALIPNKLRASELKEFRPINLVSAALKIISKVLVTTRAK